MENNPVLNGNPVFEGSGTIQPREVKDIERRERAEDLALNGGKAKLDLLGLKEEVKKAISDGSSVLYKHHFDVVVTEAQHGITGLGDIRVNANYIANSDTPWETLADIDGFIATAFGLHSSGTYVFELKLYFDGTCLFNITDLSDGSIKALAIPNMATFELQDSVSKI